MIVYQINLQVIRTSVPQLELEITFQVFGICVYGRNALSHTRVESLDDERHILYSILQ